MATVPNNKGSYTKRKGSDSYQVKIPLGWNSHKGCYDQYREDAPSEAEAIALIKEINDFLYHGGRLEEIAAFRSKHGMEQSGCATVEEYADEFCTIRTRQKRFTERTIASDRECLRRVMPYIGQLPLDRVTTADVDRMLTAMRGDDADNLNGRAYSGTTTLKTYATLNKMFKYAMKKGVIDRNPCADADVPKADTSEKRSLSIEEVRELHAYLESANPSAYNVGIAIGVDAGLRLSEMLALTWKDYRNGALSVTKSLEKEKQTTKKTKNEDSRTVPCTAFLTRMLDNWKVAQKAYFKRYSMQWGESAPIVSSKTGTHILQRNYTRWFMNARFEYPIPDDWSFHGFRHTYVTIMNRDAHIDGRTVRELSGHKTERAFQTYQHTTSEWQREAARRYDLLTMPDDGEKRCGCCAHWTQSPNDPSLGACWGSPGQVCAMNASDLCDKDAFRQGLTLEQSILRFTA